MITLSPSAKAEIHRWQQRHGSSQSSLHIQILRQGCEGLSYQLGLTPQAPANSQTFDCGSVQVVVDGENLPYLSGLNLDYSEDLMGGSFRFNNPNASQTCSCGHSFAIAAADA